jgi:hypothetical protein
MSAMAMFHQLRNGCNQALALKSRCQSSGTPFVSVLSAITLRKKLALAANRRFRISPQ